MPHVCDVRWTCRPDETLTCVLRFLQDKAAIGESAEIREWPGRCAEPRSAAAAASNADDVDAAAVVDDAYAAEDDAEQQDDVHAHGVGSTYLYFATVFPGASTPFT